ncbi:MAG: hypothetical protein QNJ68_21735 [Microcoleaceae cyanobacterium MO_207.B10]|nr:hypothetical protein [Microcoleaceae cyanobacterium MO_207.B10]
MALVGRVLNDLAKDNLKEAHKSLDRSKNAKDYVSWQLEVTSARDFFIHAKILFSNAAKKNKLIGIVAKASEAVCLLYIAQCNEMLGYKKDRKENLVEAKKIYLWLMKPPIQDQLVPTIKNSLLFVSLIGFGANIGGLGGLLLAMLLSVPSIEIGLGIFGLGVLMGGGMGTYITLHFSSSSFVSDEEYTQLENLISKDDSKEEIIKIINSQQYRINEARKITSLIHSEGWVN